MKKYLFFVSALVMGLAFTTVSCSDEDDPFDGDAANIDYSSETASAWHNYMKNVARLLNDDSQSLYNAWKNNWGNYGKSYADLFKEHASNFTYPDAKSCAQEIVEKCAEIANEVGSAKIGDPYNLYISGRQTEALYAVESWYSWHSRDDYTNNIYSIRNAYFGTTATGVADEDGYLAVEPAANSFAKALEGTTIDTQVRAAIKNAAVAIQAIPQPFRSHINSTEAYTAMEECAKLQRLLSDVVTEDDETIKAETTNLRDAVETLPNLDAIIANYVDNVVLPTYELLKNRNQTLLNAVDALAANPTNANFEAACNVWLSAREPWEKSEAFLFGPVDELGLDPNMDSWPLDQNAIVQILKSNDWVALEWDDDDDDAAVESAQNVRGFHTLEFLLFKDGKPRTVE